MREANAARIASPSTFNDCYEEYGMSRRSLSAQSAALGILVAAMGFAPAALAGSSQKVLYTFQGGTEGYAPQGGLVADASGNLYGALAFGGAQGFGLIYELTPNGKGGWTKTDLHTFQGSDGAFPESDLVFDSAGNLYGTTTGGGALNGQNLGTVFELSKNQNGSWDLSKSYSFTGGADGFNPTAGVVLDPAGNVFVAVKESFNFSGFGSVVELSPSGDGWTEQTIHTFTKNPDGAYPGATLTMDRHGNLYGTAAYGGANGQGMIFEFHKTKKGWQEIDLHDFAAGDDGSSPEGNLVLDHAGNLYGTTLQGNSVFELVKPTREEGRGTKVWQIVQIHKFGTGTDASSPTGITIDNKGNLYGPGASGGTNGKGAVYKLSPVDNNGQTTWTESVLWSFTGGANGGFPGTKLIFDKAQSNRLYGTSIQGISNYGVVYDVKK